ncbi:MAG: helix-turn-helix transcriptional regulator [Acidaminococcaceae bacterium]
MIKERKLATKMGVRKISKLKKIRQATGLSQSQLAASSGVSLRMIQKYETGDRDISKTQLATAIALAKALNCKCEDLVT